MYNFSFDLSEVLGAASILIIFFVFVVLLIGITAWIFSSLGVMNLAKKKNIPNPWLAFIPVGYSYIVGKLGFEIYASEDKKNPTLTWVTFGLSIAAILLSDTKISGLINIALLVFHSIAFYNMFKALTKNYTVFTVFTVLSDGLLGGIFLYAIRNSINCEADVINEKPLHEKTKTEVKQEENINKEEKVEVKKDDNKSSKNEEKETINPTYCSSCGSKLAKNAKFCGNCGNKIK